jgi:hypothetical protein
MARYINGKLVKSSADRKAAVESAGGVYNQKIDGNYVQGDKHKSKPPRKVEQVPEDAQTINTNGGNYFEHIEGDVILGDVYE